MLVIDDAEAKFALVWALHFGDERPGKVTCDSCRERESKSCHIGRNPVECVLDKSLELSVQVGFPEQPAKQVEA